MLKKYILFLLLTLSYTSFSQGPQLSVYAEVSIVTIGPGNELYEKFGHSSIRIKDPILNFDFAYDYGIFDFNAPNFYTNFAKGRLLYKVARYPFQYVLQSKKQEKRWIKEQVLQLSREEIQAFFLYLENNVLPQNATYAYDPYFDNCATKLRDITQQILGNKVQFPEKLTASEYSLRQLMNKEIHWNTWGNLGINVALGNRLDQIASASEYMYLPDYVFKAFQKATYNGKKLVQQERVLLNFEEPTSQVQLFLNPFLIFCILALLGLYITYRNFIYHRRSKWLDFLLFFTTGTIGVLIVFLWFFTDHTTTANNFNFLWAFPFNIVIAFIALKKMPQKWIKSYLRFLIVCILCVPVLWLGGVQLFPLSILPLYFLLLVRYTFLLSFKK